MLMTNGFNIFLNHIHISLFIHIIYLIVSFFSNINIFVAPYEWQQAQLYTCGQNWSVSTFHNHSPLRDH